MKKVIVNGLLTVAFLFAIVSCKEPTNTLTPAKSEPSSSFEMKNGRLFFKTYDDFRKTIKDLEHNKSFLDSFLSRYYANSLESHIRKGNDEEYQDKIPYFFRLLLNSKREVLIGDNIHFYDNQYKYIIPDKGYTEINSSTLKNAPKDSYGYDLVSKKLLDNPKNGRVYINSAHGDIDARHQREFIAVSPAGGQRKFVHQLRSYWDFAGDTGFDYYLLLDFKLEWRGCCHWRPAGERYRVEYNVSGDGFLGIREWQNGYIVERNEPFGFNKASVIFSDFSDGITLAMFPNVPRPGATWWQVEVNGYIKQNIVGDVPANTWTNTGNPLW